jgi:glycosyltransferase involved in cell wall biosynthesis
MSKSKPLVSVIMPVYNAEKYLTEAIKSILTQTLTNFEFIIIDDGSTDGSLEIIRHFSLEDHRIRLIKNDQNLGVADSLNKGIMAAGGIYIARMDADDISMPERLQKQTDFLRLNPEVGFCGSWVKAKFESRDMVWEYPISNEAIRCRLLFANSFAHPSVIFSRELFVKKRLFYNRAYETAEDYELWVRALGVTRAANVEEVLLVYRIHSHQVGVKNLNQQFMTTRDVHRVLIQNLGIDCSKKELDVHEILSFLKKPRNLTFIFDVEAWLQKLTRTNDRIGIYDHQILQEEISRRLASVNSNINPIGIKIMKIVASIIKIRKKPPLNNAE